MSKYKMMIYSILFVLVCILLLIFGCYFHSKILKITGFMFGVSSIIFGVMDHIFGELL
jgi:hypothetical protein